MIHKLLNTVIFYYLRGFFFAVVVTALFVACEYESAQVEKSLLGGTVTANQTVFATLATSPEEAASAATYTRLAMLRSATAKRLRKKHITAEKAQQIQYFADSIRIKVDHAVKESDFEAMPLLHEQLQQGFVLLYSGAGT